MKPTARTVPNVPLKGLHTVKSNGRTYYYAWRGGPRIDAPLGSPEFHAAFSEARNPLSGLDKRKMSAWVTLYKASDEYAGLAKTTKRVWGPWFDEIKTEFGALSARQFDRPRIRVDIKHWRANWKDRPRAADTGKQVLSRVCSYMVSEGALTTNPCEGVPNLYSSNRADVIWLPEDLEALRRVASQEVYQAAQLAALTGLRQADLLKLCWSHIGDHAIERKTGKSRGRKKALVPITKDLRTLLNSIKPRSTTILTNTDGKPWRGFGSSWNKALNDAGLGDGARGKGEGLHFHDLRGTAATNFYRAGFSIREIAETLAWSEDKVERLIDRYVKRDEILKDRIRRLEKSGGK